MYRSISHPIIHRLYPSSKPPTPWRPICPPTPHIGLENQIENQQRKKKRLLNCTFSVFSELFFLVVMFNDILIGIGHEQDRPGILHLSSLWAPRHDLNGVSIKAAGCGHAEKNYENI